MSDDFHEPKIVDGGNASIPQLMRINEVATIFGCHPQTVRRCIKRGELTPVRFGGMIFVRQDDVMAIITNRTSRRILSSISGGHIRTSKQIFDKKANENVIYSQ